jgi:uncharacterized lipoprotein YajG
MPPLYNTLAVRSQLSLFIGNIAAVWLLVACSSAQLSLVQRPAVTATATETATATATAAATVTVTAADVMTEVATTVSFLGGLGSAGLAL